MGHGRALTKAIHYRHHYDTTTTIATTRPVCLRFSSTRGDGIKCGAGELPSNRADGLPLAAGQHYTPGHFAITQVDLSRLIDEGRATQGRAWLTNCIAHRSGTLRRRGSPPDTSLLARGHTDGNVVRLCLCGFDRSAEDLMPNLLNQPLDWYVPAKPGCLMQRSLNWVLPPRRPCCLWPCCLM